MSLAFRLRGAIIAQRNRPPARNFYIRVPDRLPHARRWPRKRRSVPRAAGGDRKLWVPGVNNLRPFGRWTFAEFTEVFEIEDAFARLIGALAQPVLQPA